MSDDTMKSFTAEYRRLAVLGVVEQELSYTPEDVRQIVSDLLDKLSWVANTEVRRTGGAEFRAGLDAYQKIILSTRTGIDMLKEIDSDR